MTKPTKYRDVEIRAAHGNKLTTKSWLTEAPLRMLNFRVGIRGVRRGFDQANMIEVPGHGAGSAQLPFAECHTDFRHGTL